MSAQLNRQLLRLSALLQIERRARHAARNELSFVMANETAGVMPYQQAAVWIGDARGRIDALSGVAVADLAAPYGQWVSRLCAELAGVPDGTEPRAVTAEDVPAAVSRDWAEHLAPCALWVPLVAPGDQRVGGLLFARAEPWTEADRHLLAHLADAYAHAWLLAHARRVRLKRKGALWRKAALAALVTLVVGAGALPVRQSVLAPAEVVPRTPTLVRAPFDGVVDSVAVTPNQPVGAGQPLATLDTAQLRSKLKVAQKAREVTQTEYQQAAQLAVFDPKAKAKLAILQGHLEQQAAEIAYLQGMLDRATLTAPAAGVAVFDDPNDWIGRPVTQGERIMIVANPADVELEIRLPVGDAIPLDERAEVAFFLNVAPDAPMRATLHSGSYRAQTMPDGVVAYKLKAGFDGAGEGQGGTPRLGFKGTAKVYGETAPLALWILRRPIATARQWLTF
ncbi:efflux RND transporter periplasmic adaptor subunit [Roseomonas genomospecies 6]|nr:HlyD family efflux transporter periplasmic adaptor subunit [Roseomonas genomospecies 6]